MNKRKWTINEQATFLKKTGELLKRGYPIAEAIESVTFQLSRNRKMELNSCHDMLKDGLPFHVILQRLHFHKDLVGYVYFAEEHGSLAEAIQDGSQMLLKRDKDMQRLLKLLYYPFMLIAMTILLLVFVEKTLLPRFTSLFKTMNLEPNLFTKIVFSLSKYMPFIAISLTGLFLLFLMFYFLFFRTIPVISQKRLLITIPFIGKILKLLYTHYFSVQMSYLLSGGLSVYEALQLFEGNDSQVFYSQIGREIKSKLVTGENLEDILPTFSMFEKDLGRIVKHGQQNGKLEQELLFYSQYCISNLEEKIEKSLKVVQPILYSFIGLLIVSMYLAILLPMFHLLDGI
jgi:competence protein ComGB